MKHKVACRGCGELFLPNAKHRVYCSENCAELALILEAEEHKHKERVEAAYKACERNFGPGGFGVEDWAARIPRPIPNDENPAFAKRPYPQEEKPAAVLPGIDAGWAGWAQQREMDRWARIDRAFMNRVVAMPNPPVVPQGLAPDDPLNVADANFWDNVLLPGDEDE